MRSLFLPLLTVALLSAGILRAQGGGSVSGLASGLESWTAWIHTRDLELKDVATSYLSVVDHALLKAGESLYLPIGGPRGQVTWRKEAPGKPMVTLAAKESGVDVAVTSTGESLTLSDSHSVWTTPDGMFVTVDKNGPNFMMVLRDPNKEGFKDFKGSRFFAYNPKAVVRGQYIALTSPQKLLMTTTLGAPRPIWLMGTIELTYGEAKPQLKAYCLGETPSAQELFVPFLDATNGIETYVSGRYVETSADPSGAVTVDFNRAYNPYCARNPVFSCIKVSGRPIEARILAGEQTPHAR